MTNSNLDYLKKFAEKHDIALVEKGMVGMGDPCVGFTKGKMFVAHNPMSYKTYETIEGFENEELYAPDDVYAYEKIPCLCVYAEDENYEEALNDLAKWIRQIESLGEVEIVEYNNEATGPQAIFSGTTGYAITIK